MFEGRGFGICEALPSHGHPSCGFLSGPCSLVFLPGHGGNGFKVVSSLRQCSSSCFPLLAGRCSVSQDREIRRRVRTVQQQKVDQLIEQAMKSPGGGLQGLYQVSSKLRPKSSRRTIHFRDASGHLMSPTQELQALQEYFTELYQSASVAFADWRLVEPMNITNEEVSNALAQVSGRKALPPGQAPASLWKATAPILTPYIADTFNKILQPGTLHVPEDWHRSQLTLIPKPNKPPSAPSNLRPISVLPMWSNLLAKIAADRLRPFLLTALQDVPQFAYLAGRQVADALDRVASHCFRVPESLQGGGRSIFKLHKGLKDSALNGGMQLSLDLSKAYDRLPRARLLQTLERIGTPSDLVSLIMFIHDQALIVLTKHEASTQVRMGRGIRQGCGLSPLLWIGFTLLLFDRLQSQLPPQALTAYAEDFHVHWEFQHPRDFRNAIAQLPQILKALRDFGMDIALDKTVILLAIKGRSAPSLLKDFTSTIGGKRCLVLRHPTGLTHLPIRTTHQYLGVCIGYNNFELNTVRHRLALSWVAFHRLHVFLKHAQVPLSRRIQLWQACIWSIMQHGLSAIGADMIGAKLLVSQVSRQLRMVARSPAHVSHETSAALFTRLRIQTPLLQLRQASLQRIERSRQSIGHLQPPRVHQWWDVVPTTFSPAEPEETRVRLKEVTQICTNTHTCPVCGIGFTSHHAVSVHLGKQHPAYRTPRTTNPTIKNRRNDEVARRHALDGLPKCRHCLKSFRAWPQFFGHFHQEACPVFHAHTTTEPKQTHAPPTDAKMATDLLAHGASAPEEVTAPPPAPQPLFYDSSMQSLASSGDLKTLAAAIRQRGFLNHCPECFQWCTSPAYLSRHAVKARSNVAATQDAVLSWLHLKPVTPHPKGTPPSVGPSWLYRILTPPPINLPDLGLITTPISKHGHPNPGTRSPCSLAGQRLHRLGRLGSQVCTCNRTPRPHALSQCPHFFWKCTPANSATPGTRFVQRLI